MTKIILAWQGWGQWITLERFRGRADLPLTDRDKEARKRRLPYWLDGEGLRCLAAEAP